jgi:hypothetical protein
MWQVPWEDIRKAMTAAGWTQKEKDMAWRARSRQTPEGKAKVAAYNQTPKAKAKIAAYKNSPKGKAKIAAYQISPKGKMINAVAQATFQKSSKGKTAKDKHRKSPKGRATRSKRRKERMATDPEYAAQHNSCTALNKIYRVAKKSGLYTPAQLAKLDKRTHELLGCSSKELMQHFEKQFKPGMTHFNRGKYNRNDHTTNPTWQDDHAFPTAIMFQNKHILGLEEFVIGYKNHAPRDAFFNKIKNDHIILELIHPDCPGYPFTDGLIGVERIFKTVDEFLLFKGYINRDEFPFLK